MKGGSYDDKHYTSHKLGNLRQTVVLYKTGKFLQANTAYMANNIGNKKLTIQIVHERLLNQANGTRYKLFFFAVFNLKDIECMPGSSTILYLVCVHECFITQPSIKK